MRFSIVFYYLKLYNMYLKNTNDLIIDKNLLIIDKNILTFNEMGDIVALQRKGKDGICNNKCFDYGKDVIVGMIEGGKKRENRRNGEKTERTEKWKLVRMHPFLVTVLSSLTAGMVLSAWLLLGEIWRSFRLGEGFFYVILEYLGSFLVFTAIFGGLMVFPVLLVGAEAVVFVKGRKNGELHRKGRAFDITGAVLGVLYSLFYLSFIDEVSFGSDWQKQLANQETHTPVYTGAQLTVVVILVVGIVGYFVVNYVPLKKIPPLLLVLGMAAMYLGTIESIIWGIQVVQEPLDIFLALFPLHCVLLTARTVGYKMWEWQQIKEDEAERKRADGVWQDDSTLTERYQEGNGILSACNRFLAKAEYWPLAAFLLMWPLLGILIGVLILFGQRPDAVIKAFVETSDWNLSQRVAPQNIYYDEHYLCTVAAGGHEKIVKPKRLGVRHGHQVIVNRQLCVANAFEQVLEERAPGFHRAVRHFYDTYGFPVANMIHSKYTADAVYFLMKPLEWIFLIVLYLTDANPENRIAIQYTGKRLADFRRVENSIA